MEDEEVWYLEEAGELGVSERHMCRVGVCPRVDAHAQRRERQVDADRLGGTQPCTAPLYQSSGDRIIWDSSLPRHCAIQTDAVRHKSRSPVQHQSPHCSGLL